MSEGESEESFSSLDPKPKVTQHETNAKWEKWAEEGSKGDVNDYSPLFVSFAVSREGGSETGIETERQGDNSPPTQMGQLRNGHGRRWGEKRRRRFSRRKNYVLEYFSSLI